ncbi:MAG: hypothetical protein QOE62_3727 [Actinomycetota bacterium]|nr:hypothetical protein [Actinomycetota bacterium]
MTNRDAESTERRSFGIVVGGLGALAVSGALVPLRDHIDNANLALILVLVVVCAAIVGGRTAGAVSAITATLAFDFFLTKPFVSMRIDSADDIETALILLSVGLLVGEVAARGRRSRRDRERAASAISRVHRVAESVAHAAPLVEIVRQVRTELAALLRLDDCWLELPPFQWPLPRLERAGTIEADEYRWFEGGFAMPEFGVQLPVVEGGREVARLVLIGNPDVTVTIDERVVAVALADQLGSAFALASAVDVAAVAKESPPRDGNATYS